MTQIITGLSDIGKPYQGLVVDLWGVMHNGRALFAEAVQALTAARAQGQSITLLSNAPRRRSAALEGLANLGLSSALFDDLITSGEVAWQALNSGTVGQWGQAVHFFGAGKDVEIQDGLSHFDFVAELADANWILNVGPEPGHADASAFEAYLKQARDLHLPMVCANPDLVVLRGQAGEICAGTVARAYADLGGEVVWYGKPYAQVYGAVYESCGLGPDQLLAIGDSFKTDVTGAIHQGMDVLFVASGIHGHEVGRPLDPHRLALVAADHGVSPTHAADFLSA